MNVYVVGEHSGNPEDWSDWGSRLFVLAENEQQAKELAGDLVDSRFAAILKSDHPCHVAYIPYPDVR